MVGRPVSPSGKGKVMYEHNHGDRPRWPQGLPDDFWNKCRALETNGPVLIDDLAGVHKVLGIEGALEPAHQIQLDRVLVVLHLVDLQQADAVLG